MFLENHTADPLLFVGEQPQLQVDGVTLSEIPGFSHCVDPAWLWLDLSAVALHFRDLAVQLL